MSLPERVEQLVTPHRWAVCHREHEVFHACMLCDGGLASCEVCGGFEGSLLTSCPGERLTEEALEAVYKGNVVDFLRVYEDRDYCRAEGVDWPPDWALREMKREPL